MSVQDLGVSSIPYCVATVFSPRRAKIPKLKSSRSDTVFGKIITHPGIQYRQQFAHTCRNGNLIRLTLRQQALIEIPNKRFKTCRYHGSHIQRLTHRRPSAEAAAFEFGFPALPRVRGNADQTRHPFVRQPSQFGQHRHQRSRRYRTDAFDLLRHLGFAVKMRVGVVVDLFVQFVNQPVKMGNQLFDAFDLRFVNLMQTVRWAGGRAWFANLLSASSSVRRRQAFGHL